VCRLEEGGVPIVDSHCHASECWYEPIEALLEQMARSGVDKAILIQILGQYDNSYQVDCVRRFPDRFASVVIVDTEQPDAPRTLERLAEQGASGVRLRASVRSPGQDPLAIWRAAERLGLAVSVAGSGEAVASDDFQQLVEALPRLKIVVEHYGGVQRPGAEPQPELRQRVYGLARRPNVYIKVHGLGEIAQRAMPVRAPFPFVEPVPPILEEILAAFGAEKMMWGSDFPPVSYREGYGRSLSFVRERLAGASAADQALIFGGTALEVFPVRG
jgi:L-fuconolactonase